MDAPDFEKIVGLVSEDTERGSEIVAKLFYRILKKNGYSEEQIIGIAANMIGYLTKSLKGYERKVESSGAKSVDKKVSTRSSKMDVNLRRASL